MSISLNDLVRKEPYVRRGMIGFTCSWEIKPCANQARNSSLQIFWEMFSLPLSTKPRKTQHRATCLSHFWLQDNKIAFSSLLWLFFFFLIENENKSWMKRKCLIKICFLQLRLLLLLHARQHFDCESTAVQKQNERVFTHLWTFPRNRHCVICCSAFISISETVSCR